MSTEGGKYIESEGVPKFVEGEYSLEMVSHSVKESDPDTCCMRCSSEFGYGWFSIQEGDKTLDIPNSFGPSDLLSRLLKFGCMGITCGTLIYKWYDTRDHAAFFLAFLTHWSLILASLWFVVSFFNSIFPPAQPKRPSDPVSLRVKFSWLLFTVAAHFTLIVVVLYWSLDFNPGVTPITYTNIFSHAGVLIVWPEGLLVNRIPIRWKHLPVPMLLASCYIIWLVIHQLATDIGVPTRYDEDPDTNDDLIYPAVDFENKTVFSTVLVIVVVLVFTPLMHWLLWGLSLYSFPCNCSGFNRRYVPTSPHITTSHTSGSGSTDNINVYEP